MHSNVSPAHGKKEEKKEKKIGKETLQGLKIPSRYTTCTYLVATIAKTITLQMLHM